MSDAQISPDAGAHFAENFRRRRKSLELSQEEVVETMRRAGFSFHTTTLSRIENGQRQVPVAEALALATVVSSSVSQLAESPDRDAALEATSRLTEQVTKSRIRLEVETSSMLRSQGALKYFISALTSGSIDVAFAAAEAERALEVSPIDVVRMAAEAFVDTEARYTEDLEDFEARFDRTIERLRVDGKHPEAP